MREIGINKIHVIGTLLDEFKYSNKFIVNKFYNTKQVYSEELFFENRIKIITNNKENIIDILINKKLLSNLSKGDKVNIYGQVRSRYIDDNNNKKMLFYIYVLDIHITDNEKDDNLVELEGCITSNSMYKITNCNGAVYSSILKIHRYYRKTDYIPVVSWGINATRLSKLKEGTKIRIIGEIRNREYKTKKDNFKSIKMAYEVSVLSIEKIQEGN
ncbi:single-stranded DNA-binding protein [Clostridioides sp. GD02377]|uniref:single-stranded DNA-binding protein n=1 Tax=unclassified Clostridioides TaxID=2635829 RepID=UPI0038A17688